MVAINNIHMEKFPIPEEEIKSLTSELNELNNKKDRLEHWELLKRIEIMVKLGKK